MKKRNSRKKIFLTGGHGFIGKNIQEILGSKYEITAPGADHLDLTDSQAVFDFFSGREFDFVLHAANIGGARGQIERPDAFFLNLKMFFNLLRAKKNYGRFIMFGSGAEYDKTRDIKQIKEEEFGRHIPADQYGFYKYVCSEYAKNVDFITHIRLFGVYGKYEDWQTRFISNVICRILFGLPVVINQNVFFDYLYVSDLAKIIDLLIQKKPQHKFYNIGRGVSVDLITIAKEILRICGKNLPITVKISGLNKEYTCDVSRFKNEFSGFRYTRMEQSLKELFSYYQLILPQIDKELLSEN